MTTGEAIKIQSADDLYKSIMFALRSFDPHARNEGERIKVMVNKNAYCLLSDAFRVIANTVTPKTIRGYEIVVDFNSEEDYPRFWICQEGVLYE